MSDKKYVITITRQFGSLGRPIAKLMAEQLGIEYYDRDIVDQAAKQLKLPASVVDEEEESAKKPFKNPFSRMVLPLGGGTNSTQDDIFEAQQNIIRFLAEKNSCIIVGRCSDFILSEMEHVLNISKQRERRCVYPDSCKRFNRFQCNWCNDGVPDERQSIQWRYL